MKYGTLAEALAARESGTLTQARGMTLGAFLDLWLAQVAKPSVRDWTFKGYEVHVRRHLKPILGRLPQDKVRPAHIQSTLNSLLKGGLSPKSVRCIRGTLRTALNHTVRWGYIAHNPAAMVVGPRLERYEIKPFTTDEARKFLATVGNDRLCALYSVALTMGLRQGEALGLRWQDVDLELGQLRITRQLQRIDGIFRLVEPKTSRSRRTLALQATIVRQLRDHQHRQAMERELTPVLDREWDLVFSRNDCQPLNGTVVTHQLHRLL